MGKGVKDMVHIDYMMPFENGLFHAHYLNLAKKIPSPKIKIYSLLVIFVKIFLSTHARDSSVCMCRGG